MNEQTLQKMKQMKFFGMAAAFRSTIEDGKSHTLTADELIALLVEAEWDNRNNHRIELTCESLRKRKKVNESTLVEMNE